MGLTNENSKLFQFVFAIYKSPTLPSLPLEKIKVVSSINPLRDWVLTLVGPRYPLPAVKGD